MATCPDCNFTDRVPDGSVGYRFPSGNVTTHYPHCPRVALLHEPRDSKSADDLFGGGMLSSPGEAEARRVGTGLSEQIAALTERVEALEKRLGQNESWRIAEIAAQRGMGQ